MVFIEPPEQCRRSCDIFVKDKLCLSNLLTFYSGVTVLVEQLMLSTELVQSSFGHCPTEYPCL